MNSVHVSRLETCLHLTNSERSKNSNLSTSGWEHQKIIYHCTVNEENLATLQHTRLDSIGTADVSTCVFSLCHCHCVSRSHMYAHAMELMDSKYYVIYNYRCGLIRAGYNPVYTHTE